MGVDVHVTLEARKTVRIHGGVRVPVRIGTRVRHGTCPRACHRVGDGRTELELRSES